MGSQNPDLPELPQDFSSGGDVEAYHDYLLQSLEYKSGRNNSDQEEPQDDIEDLRYNLLSDDQLLVETAVSCQNAAISLHSYSQSIPNAACTDLHDYSQQPLNMTSMDAFHSYSQPLTANTVDSSHNYSQRLNMNAVDSSHTYSQPWPQNEHNEIHNYCINQPKDVMVQKTRIYQVNKDNVESSDQPLCLKIQYSDALTCHWLDCSQLFNSQRLLVEHLASAHINKQTSPLFYCQWKFCPRENRPFDARYKFVQHIRIHSCEKPHKCSQCDAEFTSAEGLTKHQRVHTGEKPYILRNEGGGKTFKNSADKHKHTKTHVDRFPYTCKHPGCDKQYTDPGSLRKHAKKKGHQPPGKWRNGQAAVAQRKRIESAALMHGTRPVTMVNVIVDMENPMLPSTATLSGVNNVQDLPLDLTTQPEQPEYFPY